MRAPATLLLAASALATPPTSPPSPATPPKPPPSPSAPAPHGPPASDGGTSTCPCIAWDSSSFLASDGNSITTTLGGTSYAYPLTYGTDCAAHDQTLQPYCDSSVAEPPEWCGQPWCYVDKDNCDHPASKSSYYESQSLSYSYRTCGGQNTFTSWFGDNAVSSGGHTLPDIIDTVEGYLKAITNALEVNHWELQKQVQTCQYETSCDCGTCVSGRGEWGPQDVDYQISTLTVRNDLRNDPTQSSSDDMRREECLASIVGNDFVRIAAIEANISRLGYEYYASQQLGSYVQWPGLQWCTDSYDPRYRPWYAVGASGPKDVLIVIDTSGSMVGTRISLAREAASYVLDTLTDGDYGGIVTFSSSADSYATTLVPGTAANKADMQSWVDRNVDAAGSTDYRDAFTKVWEVLDASDAANQRSGCNRIVLFLTDGEPDAFNDDDFAGIAARSEAQGEGFHLMTYALGNGARTDYLKKLACENRGVTYEVGDADAASGALDTTMASYYMLLAPTLAPCQPRWNSYTDWLSGTELLAACLPAYAKLEEGSATSCDGGLAGLGEPGDARIPELIGVACVDINLMVSLGTIRARDDYPDFEARVEEEKAACPRTTITELQLDTLRARVSSAAVCGDYSPPPASVSFTGSNSTGGGSDNAGAIAGGIVGALVVLVCLGCGCYLCQSASRKSPPARAPPSVSSYGASAGVTMQPQAPVVQGTAYNPATTYPAAPLPAYGHQGSVPLGVPVDP